MILLESYLAGMRVTLAWLGALGRLSNDDPICHSLWHAWGIGRHSSDDPSRCQQIVREEQTSCKERTIHFREVDPLRQVTAAISFKGKCLSDSVLSFLVVMTERCASEPSPVARLKS